MNGTVEQAKMVGDALSISVVVATLAQWLPAVAAVVSIIWSLIRIWETKTVQALVQKFRHRKGR